MKKFEELWPLPAPEIIIVTGPYGSGKSTFTLGTGAAPERTLVIDFEKSQKGFAQQLPFAYMDMQSILGEKYPEGYKMVNLYEESVEILDGIQPGQYDVIVLDNASLLEDGIQAYVETHPQEFGHNPAQYASMSALKWGDVKAKYSQLLTRWASKCKMVFVVVHLRDKWAGNSVVKDAYGRPVQEPKGKETLDMLSSLFVWLEIGPGGIPAARVLKCRIDRKVYISDPSKPPKDIPQRYIKELNGEPGVVSVPVLPLRLPKCTWAAIREYMRQPADLTNPAEGEGLSEHEMTDDDRLKLRAIIAQGEAEKAAVDRLKIEQKDQRTKEELIKFGRTLELEPYEVGNALRNTGLIPFNPDNWERMKEAIRTYSENRTVAA
ncbi:MAG: AAA family ATPase [Anaerolineaceae bacterium]|nr:AAA family ATPase [Anaerolineaceae bacterium]